MLAVAASLTLRLPLPAIVMPASAASLWQCNKPGLLTCFYVGRCLVTESEKVIELKGYGALGKGAV